MKKLHRKIFLIGGEPELAVYGDITTVFKATELRTAYDQSTGLKSDAIRIYFFGEASCGNMPVEIPHTARLIYESEDVVLKAHGAVRYGDWYGKARSVADLQRKKAIIVVPGLNRLNIDFVSRFIFRPVLDRLLAASGYIPFHAAGVVSSDGGCLIIGTAGAGKSNLVKGLVESGFQFLADDRILIKYGGPGGLFIHAFPEFIRYAVSDHSLKRMISPPDTADTVVPVTRIFFLDGNKSDKSINIGHISKAEAAAKLMQYISSNLEPELRRQAFTITGDICSTSCACVLNGWGDPHGWIQAVTDVLKGK